MSAALCVMLLLLPCHVNGFVFEVVMQALPSFSTRGFVSYSQRSGGGPYAAVEMDWRFMCRKNESLLVEVMVCQPSSVLFERPESVVLHEHAMLLSEQSEIFGGDQEGLMWLLLETFLGLAVSILMFIVLPRLKNKFAESRRRQAARLELENLLPQICNEAFTAKINERLEKAKQEDVAPVGVRRVRAESLMRAEGAEEEVNCRRCFKNVFKNRCLFG